MSKASVLKSFGGVGIETTWDDPIAPSYYFNHMVPGESGGLIRDYAENETMDGTVQLRQPSLDKTLWRKTIPMELTFDGHEILMRQLMGAAAQTGAGPYVWKFTPSTQPIGLSLYMNYGQGTPGKLLKYSGAKIAGATFTFGGGPVCMVSYDMIGGTVASDTVEVRGDKTFYTYNPVKRVDATSDITVGGDSVKALITDATIKVENPLTEEQTIYSAAILEPQFSGKQKVTGTMASWVDADFYTHLRTDFAAGTDSGIIITLNGTGNLEWVFTMESCYLTPGGDPEASSGGLVKATMGFMGWYDGTNDQLEIKATHDTATDYFA
jgi:hypothetical protein